MNSNQWIYLCIGLGIMVFVFFATSYWCVWWHSLLLLFVISIFTCWKIYIIRDIKTKDEKN